MVLVFGKPEKSKVTDKNCDSVFRHYFNFWNSDNRFFGKGLNSSIQKFMRALTQQQHQYQQIGRPLHNYSIQYEFYINSSIDFDHKDEFKKLYGIELINFLNNLFLLTMVCVEMNNKYVLSQKDVRDLLDMNIFPQFRETLSLLSGSIEELEHMAKNDFSKVSTLAEEMHTRSPFVTKPFYFHEESECYYILDNNLLRLTLEQFVYSVLKINPELGQKFCVDLGTIMERKVFEVLKNSFDESKIIKESSLKKKYVGSKIPDFLLKLNNLSIFIDAKAVEGNHMANVSSSEETMRNNYSKSICKGVAQCLKLIELESSPKEKNIIFVVTMFDTYLGHGQRLFDEFIEQVLIEDYGYNSDQIKELIDPDKIFIIPFSSLNNLFDESLTEKELIEFFIKVKSGEEKAYFDMFILEYLPKRDQTFLNKVLDQTEIGNLDQILKDKSSMLKFDN